MNEMASISLIPDKKLHTPSVQPSVRVQMLFIAV